MRIYDKRRFSGFLAMAISANIAILVNEKQVNGPYYYAQKWWENYHSLTYHMDNVYCKA